MGCPLPITALLVYDSLTYDRGCSSDEQVAAAAREVASSLSGDPAETERDLLSKLSGDRDQPSTGHTQLRSEQTCNTDYLVTWV